MCIMFDRMLSRRPLTASERDQELYVAIPPLGMLRDAHVFGFNVYVGGKPGAGKTTLLRHMEYELAGEAVLVRAEEASSATELLAAIAASIGPAGRAPSSFGGTELDVGAVFEAIEAWRDRPGCPRCVLVDNADAEQVRVLFGRYRDSMWDLPLTWIVASRRAAPPPPADSFFDRVTRLEPWTADRIRELIELRIPRWPEDWRDEVAETLAPATPSRAMLALQTLVLSRHSSAILRSIADDRERANALPRRLRDLYDALNQAGPAHAGDERLADATDVSRSRIAHGLNELQSLGLVMSEPEGRRVRYTTKLHSLLVGTADLEAVDLSAADFSAMQPEAERSRH